MALSNIPMKIIHQSQFKEI